MATKRSTAEPVAGWEVDVPSAPVPPQIVEDDEESILDRLRSTQGEDRDRMKVKVYRKVPGSTGLEWCTDYTVAEWEEGDVSRVRAEWGPGSYELRVVSQGKRGILWRDHFRIAPPPAVRIEPQPAPQAAGSSDLADVVRMLAEGQQRILEAVSQRPDPAAQLQSTLGLMVSMREAMGLNVPPPPPAPAADPGAMLGQLVGAIRTLREVSAEVAPPVADTDNPLSMLPQVLDLVKTGMQRGQDQVPMQALSIPASLQDDAMQQEGEPVGILVLRGQLGRLVEMAKSNADPTKGGEFVADNLPDELLPHLALQNWFEILSAFHSGVKPHREWFEKARDEAIRILGGDQK